MWGRTETEGKLHIIEFLSKAHALESQGLLDSCLGNQRMKTARNRPAIENNTENIITKAKTGMKSKTS